MAEFRLSNFTSGAVLTAAELNTGLTYASYTPDWTQGVAITKTVNWARYTQFGKMVSGSIKMTATGAGTANTKITVSLPANASTNNFLMGTMVWYDANQGGNTQYNYSPHASLYESTSTIAFTEMAPSSDGPRNTRSDSRLGQDYTSIAGTAVTGVTIASGDIIYIQFQYEAA